MDMSFGKEKGKMHETQEAEWKKLLELELSLDSSDLRSHAWYHGGIPRAHAEEIVTTNGSFLIRDCISQPGDFVLTCHWNNQTRHFVIQKKNLHSDTVYERIQYQLEDEAYDSIPDLVRVYVGGKKPITISSGARISTPVNRTAPLSFYATEYAAQNQYTLIHGTLTRPSNRLSEPVTGSSRASVRHQHSHSTPIGVGCTVVRSPAHSPPRGRKDTAPTLPLKGRSSSMSRPADEHLDFNTATTQVEERSCSNDGVIGARPTTDHSKVASHSLPRRLTPKSLTVASECNVPNEMNILSHNKTRPIESFENNPPPKPSRVPSLRAKTKKTPQYSLGEKIQEGNEDETKDLMSRIPADDLKTPTECREGNTWKTMEGITGSMEGGSTLKHSRLSEMYHASGSDSGTGSGDSVLTSASDVRNRDSQASFGDTGSVQLEEDFGMDEESIFFSLPERLSRTSFDLENYNTLLLNSIENKPLDSIALEKIKSTLLECGSRVLAAHLTRVDLELLNGVGKIDFGLGVISGIEMITLPYGQQLRNDLIERTECMKFFVAVTIMMTPDLYKRAEIISRWINIAIDTKTAMGNLYGFTGIILGLCLPEIQRLTSTWYTVRQKYTESAFNFESKLRSTLKSMNECKNPQAPNTIIPHILPLILLLERDPNEIYTNHRHCSSILQWESTASDYGLQMLLSHLQEARNMTQSLTLYSRNAKLILPDINTLDLNHDMFQTEFHMKFLWGSKGAVVNSAERHANFQKIIAKLSENCQPV